MDHSTVATAGVNAVALEYNGLRVDKQLGWMKPAIKVGGIYQNDSWAYQGVSGTVGTVTVTSDGRERYEVGQKVRFKQGGAYKYFFVVAITATTIDITAGTDYTLTNAAITDLYISGVDRPLDWPLRHRLGESITTVNSSGAVNYTSATWEALTGMSISLSAAEVPVDSTILIWFGCDHRRDASGEHQVSFRLRAGSTTIGSTIETYTNREGSGAAYRHVEMHRAHDVSAGAVVITAQTSHSDGETYAKNRYMTVMVVSR